MAKLLPGENYKHFINRSLEYLAMKKPIARSGNHECPDVLSLSNKRAKKQLHLANDE